MGHSGKTRAVFPRARDRSHRGHSTRIGDAGKRGRICSGPRTSRCAEGRVLARASSVERASRVAAGWSGKGNLRIPFNSGESAPFPVEDLARADPEKQDSRIALGASPRIPHTRAERASGTVLRADVLPRVRHAQAPGPAPETARTPSGRSRHNVLTLINLPNQSARSSEPIPFALARHLALVAGGPVLARWRHPASIVPA